MVVGEFAQPATRLDLNSLLGRSFDAGTGVALSGRHRGTRSQPRIALTAELRQEETAMIRTTDAQIKRDLMRELGHDGRLGTANIDIGVDRYVVTLTGSVDNASIQLLIQDAAWRVEGVMDVISKLTIQPPATVRSDNEIATEVAQALEWDTLLPDGNIKFSVSNGWVGLEGTVTLSREREGVERLVRRLAGVRGVYNNIVVNSSEVKPENVSDTISEELKRRAELEAKSIKVLLKDGTVTLSGCVHSWEERCAVINAASRVPGVDTVKDSLAITPAF